VSYRARCKFCDLAIVEAPPFCPARMLIPGERFPHEAETPGDQMTRRIFKAAEQRARFPGSRRKR
jgi:hypothetical protein